jgi:hypothetical protein
LSVTVVIILPERITTQGRNDPQFPVVKTAARCGTRLVKTRSQKNQTNCVCPGMAMGRMGSFMSQVRLSGTSFSSEFRASVQETSLPV